MSTGRLAVVGGHSILGTAFARDAERVEVETDRGAVSVLDAGDWVVMQRHGLDRRTAAPYVDHRAHLLALRALGCDRVVALASVGGLRTELGVGTFLAPDDFVAFHLGLSIATDPSAHQIPGFDDEWRRHVLATWHGATNVPLRDGGVYWQTIGPRFETRAEIRLIAAFADVVGMTIAGECILARELGIPYAAVCIVDNLANGIAERPLTVDEFENGVRQNRERLLGALDAVLPKLAS